MMKAANNGPAAFGEHVKLEDKESNAGGGRSRKKTGDDDDEGPSSDKGEEDEDEEVDRKNRLGLNKKSGYDDDDEGPRGGDLDDDDYDVEKGEYLALFVLYFFYESMLKVISCLLLVSFM
jgi:transcription initiation factor TFIIF subunit alpha